MRRRDVIGLFAALAWQKPPAFAQSSHKRSLIGFLSPGAQQFTMHHTAAAFLQGMRDLGCVEGRDFDVVYRFSEGYQDRLPALAEELAKLKPRVILASAAKFCTCSEPSCDWSCASSRRRRGCPASTRSPSLT